MLPSHVSEPDGARPHAWFLLPAERGNSHTWIDRRHLDGTAWTTGNHVVAHIHGADYFAALARHLSATGPGDLVLFTDWRGDPDELLVPGGPTVSQALSAAARRGADVRGLVWRSHLDRLSFSATENRHIGEAVEAAGGQCLLDQRVRLLGSHHQKLVVVRHRDHPADDVAFVGGIDLCHSRRDDENHQGDPQRQPMAEVYGPTPPWHDVQLEIRGPAVGDLETTFRERWNDPWPLSLNPVHLVGELVHREQVRGRPLPGQAGDPAPYADGVPVQVLRTYPRRRPAYPFAPRGERSIARAYLKAIHSARRLVYVEDQYLWAPPVVSVLAEALSRERDLRMALVIPRRPDQDGRVSLPPNLVGREAALRMLREAGADRVAVLSPENRSGIPVYVHAKITVVDDTWACVGSDNINRRSWTHDSEVSAAVVDGTDDGFPAQLRLRLAREHLGEAIPHERLMDPVTWFDALLQSADALDAWHASGRQGPRPPGRLRHYPQPRIGRVTSLWARPLYRCVYDPDGRSFSQRRRGDF